jgi:hypothetical protein
MTRRARLFLLFFLLLTAAFAAVVLDGLRAIPAPALDLATRVTRLPGPLMSAGHLEPHLRLYDDYSRVVHPGLPALDHQDQIHAR